MNKKKYPKFEDYDFSDCREITGDELYRINGGGRIQSDQNETPPEGDSSNNSDSYTVQSGDTLSQIVYDYNQANGTHLTVDEVAALSGIDNPDVIFPGQDIIFGTSDTSGQTTDPTNPAGSTSTSSNPSSTSSGNSSDATSIALNNNPSIPDNSTPGASGIDNSSVNSVSGAQTTALSYQQQHDMACKNLLKQKKEPSFVRNTQEALDLYYNNDGSPVIISGEAFENVKKKNNKIFEKRIKSGKTSSAEGNYSLDMTLEEFFIGKTRIDYVIETGEKTSTVTFTAFNGDGFWDADIFASKKTEDGPGPNNELPGGIVYPFMPRSWSITFDNPKKMNWLLEN